VVAKYSINQYEMHCERKLKLKSHNTSYCLIGVATKAGLTVYMIDSDRRPVSNRRPLTSLSQITILGYSQIGVLSKPNPNPNLNPNLNLNPIPNINPNLNPKPNPNLNLNIKEWENAVKKNHTHTQKKTD
jgi:hypothetical protein